MSKFQVGCSGNPAGRPRGILDKRLKYRESLEAVAPLLIQEAVNRALSGNDQLLAVLLNKLIPSPRPEAGTSLPLEGATISIKWEHDQATPNVSVRDASLDSES